jgi:hypothetical protein
LDLTDEKYCGSCWKLFDGDVNTGVGGGGGKRLGAP